MSESQISDARANALSGTTDSVSELVYPAIGSTYYTDDFRRWYHLLRAMHAVSFGLQVYKDGDLTFGVRPGRYMDGDTARDYAGAAGQGLTNNQTNYVYLTADGTLTVNTTGLPDPSATPHVPLASIETAGGTYAASDITDYRGRSCFGLLGRADRYVPYLALTGADDGDGTGSMTIQARDLAGNDLAERFLARVWIADAAYSEPDPQTGFSVTTGEQMRQIEANADYEVISDASGTIVMDIDAGGAKTVHVMAELDGRIWTASAVITSS